MSKRLNISFDSDMVESISAEFDLRAPNKEALRKLIFTLDGDYDPDVMQVLNLATGVGKTYLMAAFIEYLRRQGVGNVMIVTPGKTVQHKTVQNFTPSSVRYISGSSLPPDVVTPQDYSQWVARKNGPARLVYGREIPMLAFIFNIQQLIAPRTVEGETQGGTQEAMRRKPRRFDENAGVLFDYLKELDDLVVIADESHLYGTSAAAFNAALKELQPAAAIGLTASPSPKDEIIFKFPLYKAIQDKYVKAPVLAFRKSGYGDDIGSEEQQLRDALQLRKIKQAHYDFYAQEHHKDRFKAVVFIVCSDVDHATQVADLLRTSEYLANASAVLQVDSKHEDELTQKRLENLDHSESPVLAVVSVNKLKEGWDVKNIAVVVTLRAMASEVLTQQTMGRGLRLPFGKYTGVWQIDQLDIISHRSFKELLEAENVLEQFGLENAIEAANSAAVKDAIRKAVEKTDENTQREESPISDKILKPSNNSDYTRPDSDLEGMVREVVKLIDHPTITPSIGVREINDNDWLALDDAGDLQLVIVERNPRFKDLTYNFPTTSVEYQSTKLKLSELSDDEIIRAAKRVTSTGDMIHRKEIVAVLGKKLSTMDAEGAEVDSQPIPEEKAKKALVKLIAKIQNVPKEEGTLRYIKDYLVPRFMKEVTIDHWTAKALVSAQIEFKNLLDGFIKETTRKTREVTTVSPQPMPGGDIPLSFGEKIYDPIDSRSEFVRGRMYSGWRKSLFEAESFDSYSGEYQLARLLNTSPNIVWWHRLHAEDKAFIYYTPKDRYFPDFVALDDEGVYWIIEGKDDRGRENEQVQAKKKAAEALVRSLITLEEFAGQNWGYLVAYEGDIEKSESWNDLKTLANPVSNMI